MKSIITVIITFFTINGMAQTADAFNEVKISEVPKEVQGNFEKMNPNISLDSWRVAGRVFEAKYKTDKHWTYSRFNDKGLYLETRVLKDWEKDATESLKKGKQKTTYKYWEVIEYYEVTKSDKGVYYVIQLEDKGKLQTLYMDQDGSLRDISKSGY